MTTRHAGGWSGLAALLAMTMTTVPVETQRESVPLRILCSNVIKEAIERLRPSFEQSSGLQLSVVYGASAELRRNAQNDQSFDLALLTTGVIDELASTGGIVPGSVQAIAQANLAVAAQAGAAPADVSSRDGMRRRLLASRSVTYSRDGGGVPAIERMIAELGIAAELQSRIVKQTEAGRAAEAVALGEQELAFAPVTEIVAVKGVRVLGLFPDEFQSPLAISSGVGAKARNASGARALAAFLLTPASMRVIEATGMSATKK